MNIIWWVSSTNLVSRADQCNQNTPAVWLIVWCYHTSPTILARCSRGKNIAHWQGAELAYKARHTQLQWKHLILCARGTKKNMSITCFTQWTNTLVSFNICWVCNATWVCWAQILLTWGDNTFANTKGTVNQRPWKSCALDVNVLHAPSKTWGKFIHNMASASGKSQSQDKGINWLSYPHSETWCWVWWLCQPHHRGRLHCPCPASRCYLDR